MKLFIWKGVSKLTNNFHSEGSAVVVASSITTARGHFREYAEKELDESFHYCKPSVECEIFTREPDAVFYLVDDDGCGSVFVFPNAGCC